VAELSLTSVRLDHCELAAEMKEIEERIEPRELPDDDT
jgi:hypothetical protein